MESRKVVSMIDRIAGPGDCQKPFDAAVVMPTVLRPSLLEAVRSVFRQEGVGRVQLLIGIDVARGSRSILDTIARECPESFAVSVFDPGYSTSARHGGLYSNFYGGALRTILTYAANSRRVAYLDDDNWFAPNHLSTLTAALEDHDWAHSLRWMVDPDGRRPMYVDETESAGLGRGIWGENQGGFVDTNSLMVDKMKCHPVFHLWSFGPLKNGGGEDRLMFKALSQSLKGRSTEQPTSYYVIDVNDDMHPHRVAAALRTGYFLNSPRPARTV